MFRSNYGYMGYGGYGLGGGYLAAGIGYPYMGGVASPLYGFGYGYPGYGSYGGYGGYGCGRGYGYGYPAYG
jgi:hypothetical protein